MPRSPSSPLDAGAAAIRAVVAQQARLLAATEAEQDEAAARVAAVLSHTMFDRVRAAAARGGVRREVPVSLAVDDGTLVEGVVDLAFDEPGGWVVVDFKTDLDPAESLDAYLRQVQLYAESIRQATGRPASGVLLQL